MRYRPFVSVSAGRIVATSKASNWGCGAAVVEEAGAGDWAMMAAAERSRAARGSGRVIEAHLGHTLVLQHPRVREPKRVGGGSRRIVEGAGVWQFRETLDECYGASAGSGGRGDDGQRHCACVCACGV